MGKGVPVRCHACGKTLLHRLPNGVWEFIFGRDKDAGKEPPVHIRVYGSIEMVCLRRSCRAVNTLNFFPDTPNQPHGADLQVGNPNGQTVPQGGNE